MQTRSLEDKFQVQESSSFEFIPKSYASMKRAPHKSPTMQSNKDSTCAIHPEKLISNLNETSSTLRTTKINT